MIRRIIVAILRLAMRVYFRRVEVVGIEHVPLDSPVIFVLNHPNALVDPAVLLSLAPRRVSFLAKSPLFRMPVLGFFVRAMDCIPVYRKQDEGEDISRNNETFTAARKLLARGGTIGICPEGVSHDEPRLMPIKTGAARIALGAVSTAEVAELKIVPAGLYYTSKTKFRSAALLYFGKPIEVNPVELEADGNPPRVAVRELSDRIETALRAVMLDAEHEEALQTISRAERIFSSETSDEGSESLAEELQLQQRFVKAYRVLQDHAPERLRRLEVRMSRFEEELNQAGVDPDDLSAPKSTSAVFLHLISRVLVFLVLIGPALLGFLVHYPAYRLGGYLATRFSKDDDDVVSTVKIMSAMLLFPLTWLVAAFAGYKFQGWLLALAAVTLIPAAGYLAIRFFEGFDEFMGGLRALAFFLVRRRFFVRLLAERKAIRSEILALGKETANL
ncbi:MAG TPA: lysophospholipid acyltransferase family protein [Pyrinomonadaceae bacterium]|jgi:1-acyl-sn-glycerol-3-phosphate acyltransferase|nr:lysophospholipid acyltransferase family protein [Pyrinomonadaceae bacterium]